MGLAVAGACSLLMSIALTPLVRGFARRAGIVAAPRNDRWHREPTALLGGIAICASFLVVFGLDGSGARTAAPVVAAATLLFGVGLVDDLLDIRPLTKLVA